jgi:hypothetical protein
MSSASDRVRGVKEVLRTSMPPGEHRVCIAVCASPSRLATLERATLRIGSFRPPPEASPRVPVPHTVAIMTLEDGLDLELLGIPLEAAYAPLWPLALCNARVVVRLDPVGGAELDAACAWLGLVVHEVDRLVAGFSEDDEEQVATMLAAAAAAATGA